MNSDLIVDIEREKKRLLSEISHLAPASRSLKVIEGTGGKVSASDLIAYQIGWGKFLIRWYEAGIHGEIPEMPGEGFSSWDYLSIAKHFYQKYLYDSSDQQVAVFEEVVYRILEIIKTEQQTGHLDQVGVWPWCTLPSGKQWPLSKWIRVNTASPYKRATELIKKAKLY